MPWNVNMKPEQFLPKASGSETPRLDRSVQSIQPLSPFDGPHPSKLRSYILGDSLKWLLVRSTHRAIARAALARLRDERESSLTFGADHGMRGRRWTFPLKHPSEIGEELVRHLLGRPVDEALP